VPTAQLGKIVAAIAEQTVPTDAQEDALVAFATCLSRGAVTYFDAHAFSSPPVETMALVVKSLVDCLDPVIARLSVAPKLSRALQDVVSHKWMYARPDVFAALEPLFGYRFKAVWIDALAALRRYLEHNACAGHGAMHECVAEFTVHVVKMREQAFEAKDRHTQGVTNSILGAILRGGGVQSVLGVVPLRREEKLLLTNAWLLPLLHEHLRCSSMALFASTILPLADELTSLAAEANDGGRLVEGKNASMLAAQLWGLLPGFCQNPSDLEQDAAVSAAFDAFATCVSDGADIPLRQSAFSGLRALSLSIPADNEAMQKRFAKGLKKLFPALCLVIQQTSADRRGAALESVTKAAQACGDPKLVTSLLRKSVRQLLEASMTDADEDSSVARHAATDVAIALAESGAVPSDSAEIDFLERAMSPLFLDPSDTGLQKKAYRATALLVDLGVIGKSSDAGKSFIEETAAAAGSVATSAKGTRLNLIQALVTLSKSDRVLLESCTTSFLSEIVLGTRDVSEKTRASSFAALSALARAWYASGERAEGLSVFLTRLAAGLAGRTITMLSAALTSLSHVIYEYRGEASIFADFAHDVDALFALSTSGNSGQAAEKAKSSDDEDDDDGRMSTEEAIQPGPVAILLRHSSREVQKAALGTVKMATSALGTPTPARLIRVLPAILPGLMTVAAKSKKKETRLRVRVILERLLRKCGRETLEAVFPQEHAKLLAAVRKQYSRDMTKKHEKRENRRAEKASAEKASHAGKGGDGNDDDEGTGSADGSDFELSDSDSDIEREILDGDELAGRLTKSRRPATSGGPLLVRENGDNVVDLLETRVADGFMTRGEVAEASKRAQSEQNPRKHKTKKDAFKLAEDGRPIFAESDAESDEAEQGSVRDGDGNDDAGGSGGKKRKRRVADSGARVKKVKGSFGGEYRSRRGAAGDMKRPGMPDPYAYIPLGSGAIGGDVSKALVRQGGKGKGSRQGKANKLGGRRGIPARR
jgi:ribosomal RNA-processing protein 12